MLFLPVTLGGFFIAVFRKLKDLVDKPKEKSKDEPNQANIEELKEEEKIEQPIIAPPEEVPDFEEEIQIPKKNKNGGKEKVEFLLCNPEDPDIEYLASYYGFGKDFPFDRIIAPTTKLNKIIFLSKGVKEILDCDKERTKLNIVNMGVVVFLRNKSKYGSLECIFRISQDGVYNVLPYMTKRLVKCSEEAFTNFVAKQDLKVFILLDII